ncbi:MAG TPA: hypothetical protein VM821_01550, partial [Abditibacteriaceae bacterium]|nr:hypothetical protein [Abditibacteriaceae bacterium]
MKDHFPVSPPIPTPDGNIAPSQNVNSPLERGDWKSAPPIVRGWAYPLTWLGIVIFPILIFASFQGAAGESGAENIGVAIVYGAFLAFVIWLNRALKNGTPA